MPTINMTGQGPNPNCPTFNQSEAAMQNQYANLQSRISEPLTPASWKAVERGLDTLGRKLDQFSAKVGRAANVPPLSDLRSRMGTQTGSMFEGAATRLGWQGGRAASQRDWTAAARAAKELDRMEATAKEQLRWEKSAPEQANLQRRIAAINRGRGVLQAGGAGNRGIVGDIGAGFGAAGLLFKNPILRTALSAIGTVVAEPVVAQSIYSGIVGLGDRYRNYTMANQQLGRAGGFAGSALAAKFYNEGITSEAAIPGGLGTFRTARAKALGLGPEDITRNVQNFGIQPTSAEDAATIAETVRRGALGNTGLNENDIAQYLGQARATGNIQGGGQFNTTSARAMDTLQKVMTNATALGLDRSATLRTIMTLQQSGSGLSPSTSGLADFMNRLSSSGAPSMRSGAGVVSAVAGINSMAGQMGTSATIPANIMFGQLFQKSGGAPKSEDALRSFLHIDKQTWASDFVATPAAQAALQGYISAANSGDAPGAIMYLGQILRGHPDTVAALAQRSPLTNLGPNIGPRALSAVLNIPLDQGLAISSTRPGTGLPGFDTGSVAQGLMQRNMRDLQITPIAAAGMVGSLRGEGFTTGNEGGKPAGQGGFGIAQWTGDRRKKFFAWANAQGLDPSQYETQQRYLEYDLTQNFPDTLRRMRAATTPGEASDIFTTEYENPANLQSEKTRRAGYANEALTGYASNDPTAMLNMQAEAQASSLKSSEYASVSVQRLATAADEATAALQRWTKALGPAPAAQRYPEGMFSGGMWVPNSAMPQQRLPDPVK